MLRRKNLLLLHNIDAVASQPIGLLVIFITAGVILTLLSLLVPSLLNEAQIHRVESQIDRILIEAENMFEYADNHSSVTIHVEFPASLRFLVLGYLPQNSTDEPANISLEEKTSNNYYYIMNDGTMRCFHSNARFSNKNMTQAAIFYSGCYDITLELRQREGKTYVALHT